MTEEQALYSLTALCSQAEHCQKEMLDKMARWGIEEDAQARIMEHLIKENYVNEERYCRGFVHDKMEYNGWGRRKIEQALWTKQIDREVSAPVLDEIDEEQWIEKLRPLIASKRKTTKGRNAYEVNQKLLRFAIGRGFSFSQAKACMDGDIDDVDYSEDF